MTINNHWPALEYDYREEGISLRSMRKPTMNDIVEICDFYEEKLELYGKERDLDNYKIVKDAIFQIKNQVTALASQDKKYDKQMSRVNKIQEEFEILKAGDLEEDPVRTPQSMHDDLVKAEGDYITLQDAIESYKRQVRMLEQSIDPKLDKKIL